jgi:uncharacterized protein
MRIWVDADACPGVIKEILYRAADRTGTETVLVAGKPLRTPQSAHVRAVVVRPGPDAADFRILEEVAPGDLVVTGDIPLAARSIEREASALTPQGVHYTRDNIGQALAMRNLMDELRGAGMVTGGPAPLSKRERQLFAAHLDRILAASA